MRGGGAVGWWRVGGWRGGCCSFQVLQGNQNGVGFKENPEVSLLVGGPVYPQAIRTTGSTPQAANPIHQPGYGWVKLGGTISG